MASGKTNYLAQKLLDHEFGIATYSFPSTVYLALFTTAPTAAGGGVEVSGSGYSRAAVTMNPTNWSRSGQTVTNAGVIPFGVFTGAVSTVVSTGVYDAAIGGNLLWFGDLGASYQKSFVANDQAVFPAGSITITES